MGCLNPVKNNSQIQMWLATLIRTEIFIYSRVFLQCANLFKSRSLIPWYAIHLLYCDNFASGILLVYFYESQMLHTNICTWPAVNIAFNKSISILSHRQNGHHFEYDIFKCIFVKKDDWVLIKISLKFVPKGPIISISALVHIMAWCRPGDKPLFEPVMVSLPTHICITQPQWVKTRLQRLTNIQDVSG